MSNVKHQKTRRVYRVYRQRLGDGLCPICGNPKDLGYTAYCRLCRNAYQRAHRPKYRHLSLQERLRNIARSYVKVLRSRGKIIADMCFACGSKENVELHHPDIDNRPLDVIPLCRQCHKGEHP